MKQNKRSRPSSTISQEEVVYPCLIITQKGVRLNAAKISAVKEYSRFIKDYTQLGKPLVVLTKRKAKWEQPQEQSCTILREYLCNEPVLQELLKGCPSTMR